KQLENTSYWIKQLVGLICGVCFAMIPLLGANAFIIFFSVNLLLSYVTYAMVFRADLDLLGPQKQFDLLTEGFMPSFGTFMLTWTMAYTLLH
ncbi:MAG: hypothetical protein SGPRY_013572, partial [Prymnesium sp.]